MRATFFLPLLFLAACGGAAQDLPRAQLEQKAISQNFCLPVKVTTLTRAEKAELADMVHYANPLAIDRVALKAPYLRKNDKVRADAIRALLLSEGVPARVIQRVQEKEIPANTTHVEICYSRAVPLACDDWSVQSMTNYANAPMTNFGCSTANNLAQQTAHPADLAGRDGNVGIDTQRSQVVIDGYKRNNPVELPEPTASVTTQQ